MKIILVIFLLGHAIAHLVGFVVPWKIAKLEEMPYSTKIFFTKIDLGEQGIRLYGILWLLAFCFFLVDGILILLGYDSWQMLVLISSLYSLILTIFGLPLSKIGIVANVILLLFLLISYNYIGFTF